MKNIEVEEGFSQFHGRGIVWCGKGVKRVSLDDLLRHIILFQIKLTDSIPAIEAGQVIGHARKVVNVSAWVVFVD